jgi:hypothetical protein
MDADIYWTARSVQPGVEKHALPLVFYGRECQHDGFSPNKVWMFRSANIA